MDNKTIYIPKGYINNQEICEHIYFKYNDSDEFLGKVWRGYDFQKAENRIFELQCELTKATFRKNQGRIRRLQDKIVHSSEARMLAVRKVAELSKTGAGIDKVIWRKDSEKMKAVILLNNNYEYKANPLKQFIFKDKKSGKTRQVGIPTSYDRAMQILYAYALEPIAEVQADRKSFAFRKGRSPEQAHAFIMDCLTDTDSPEWVLVTDIKSYYDTISHKWLLSNIPMQRNILRQFLKCGHVFNGELFQKEEGISLGSNLSTILGNMTLDRFTI